jgi:hypothetical protein
MQKEFNGYIHMIKQLHFILQRRRDLQVEINCFIKILYDFLVSFILETSMKN